MLRRYARWLIGTTAALLSAAALFNGAVDPLGVYQPPWSKSWEACKARSIDRIPKSEIARSVPLDAVIVGDSRVLRGFDPRHPSLAAFGRTYNLGVSAGSIYEATRMLDLCRENHPPKLVIWSLAPELVDGDRRERTSFDYELSRLNPRLNPVLYHAHNLWGRDVFRASIDVLKRRWKGRHTDIRDGFDPSEQVESDPHGLFCRWLPAAPEPSAAASPPRSTRGEIARSLDALQQQKTQLIVLFPPVHAAYLEGLSQQGLWDAYERGKRQIVQLAGQCNRGAPGRPEIIVWDFSTFRGLAAEPPPAEGSRKHMTWYLDPLHFRETLGSVVLDRLFDRSDEHSDFGVVLTTGNLETHLTALRADRDRYRRESADVVRLVSEQAGTVR